MKELKDGELISLAQNEIRKMDIHSWSQIVISLLVIVQAIFLIFDIFKDVSKSKNDKSIL